MVRATIGARMHASATPPASAENRPVGRTIHAHAKMPITIDGMPFSVSATNRTSQPAFPPPNSAR